MSKERPILFSAPMVRAILEGRKTITRRALKPQLPPGWEFGLMEAGIKIGSIESPHPKRGKVGVFIRKETSPGAWVTDVIRCPYGKPGDRLWVRETFARVGHGDPGYLTYKATYPRCLLSAHPDLENVPEDIRTVGERWKPSIHMPRSDSRILLEVIGLRVERLQDITPDQAIAEGVDADICRQHLETSPTRHTLKECELHGFAGLWESINGAGSWDANPMVWVVEFERIQP